MSKVKSFLSLSDSRTNISYLRSARIRTSKFFFHTSDLSPSRLPFTFFLALSRKSIMWSKKERLFAWFAAASSCFFSSSNWLTILSNEISSSGILYLFTTLSASSTHSRFSNSLCFSAVVSQIFISRVCKEENLLFISVSSLTSGKFILPFLGMLISYSAKCPLIRSLPSLSR